MASARELPHMSGLGRSETQNAGRSDFPNSLQRIAWSSCTQRIPAGLPCGMPGIGEVIDGAMQQAPQWLRQGMDGICVTVAVYRFGNHMLGKPAIRRYSQPIREMEREPRMARNRRIRPGSHSVPDTHRPGTRVSMPRAVIA